MPNDRVHPSARVQHTSNQTINRRMIQHRYDDREPGVTAFDGKHVAEDLRPAQPVLCYRRSNVDYRCNGLAGWRVAVGHDSPTRLQPGIEPFDSNETWHVPEVTIGISHQVRLCRCTGSAGTTRQAVECQPPVVEILPNQEFVHVNYMLGGRSGVLMSALLDGVPERQYPGRQNHAGQYRRHNGRSIWSLGSFHDESCGHRA